MVVKIFLASISLVILQTINLMSVELPVKSSADQLTADELKMLIEKRILTQLQSPSLHKSELDNTMRFVYNNIFSSSFDDEMKKISDDPSYSDYHRSKVILYLINSFLKSKTGSVRPEELQETFGKNRWYKDSEVKFKALMGLVLPDKLSKDHIHYQLDIPVGKLKINYVMRMIAQPPHEFDTPIQIEIAFYGCPKDPEWLKNDHAWQEWLKTHPGWRDKKPLLLIDGVVSKLIEKRE